MNHEQAIKALRAANAVAIKAKANGAHPFGAVLIAPDHETILLEAGNVSTVRHAENELARAGADRFESDYLWQCTLVTNFEPCVMCTGTIYWANIGRIVYGVPESALLQLTGDHEENPTLDMPCREIIKAGPKMIEVLGPFSEVEAEVLELHRGFWN
jgi:tRNA(Arg) A34 adenosine deaminase TadA